MNTILRMAAANFARQAARKHIAGNPRLDPKIGWSLMRDREIPVGSKILALGVGAGVTALLVALEVPLESIIDFVIPVAGISLFGLFDGAEMIVCPLLIAGMTLPFIAPVPVKQGAMQDRRKALPAN